jgi:hypothetical protein
VSRTAPNPFRHPRSSLLCSDALQRSSIYAPPTAVARRWLSPLSSVHRVPHRRYPRACAVSCGHHRHTACHWSCATASDGLRVTRVHCLPCNRSPVCVCVTCA